MAYNTVSVAATATLIVAANNQRKGIILVNNSANVIYVGPDTSITSSNAIPLEALGGNLEMGGYAESWTGNIYGIASGASDLRYWEWGQ